MLLYGIGHGWKVEGRGSEAGDWRRRVRAGVKRFHAQMHAQNSGPRAKSVVKRIALSRAPHCVRATRSHGNPYWSDCRPSGSRYAAPRSDGTAGRHKTELPVCAPSPETPRLSIHLATQRASRGNRLKGMALPEDVTAINGIPGQGRKGVIAIRRTSLWIRELRRRFRRAWGHS